MADKRKTKAVPQAPDLAHLQRLKGTPYAPIESLGAGSTGEVMRVRHVELNSEFVLKILHYEVDDQPELADRMRLEAQALARLKHANIVDVVDYGVADGRPFFVMENLDGRALSDELDERGELPLSEATAIATQMLDGLGAIHKAGLVHRDIKPSNILLCRGPRDELLVKIIDFGVIKIVAPSEHHLTPLENPTETGTSLGTPRYLSPEQATGSEVTARSDLYSAALVVYEMICGRAAFAHHDEIGKLLVAQLRETPKPPSQFAKQDIPKSLDGAIMKALEKKPDVRFGSAAALQFALEAAASITTPTPTPAREPDKATEKMPEVEDMRSPPASWNETEVIDTPAPSPSPAHADTVRQPSPYEAAHAAAPALETATLPAETERMPEPQRVVRRLGKGSISLLVGSAIAFLLLTVFTLIMLRKLGVLS